MNVKRQPALPQRKFHSALLIGMIKVMTMPGCLSQHYLFAGLSGNNKNPGKWPGLVVFTIIMI